MTKEIIERILEVIGVKPDPFLIKGKTSLFGISEKKDGPLDWTITEKGKSDLALELLALLRMCFKDLAGPDFKHDLYTKVEIQVQPILDNFMCPPLRHYRK